MAYGFCQSENSQDISAFREIIKHNVPKDTIKIFISDEGTGITSATTTRKKGPKKKEITETTIDLIIQKSFN